MADVNDSMFGSVVGVAIATDLVTPVYKDVVCSKDDIGVNGTTTGGQEIATRCGVYKAAGTAGWQIVGSGVGNKVLSGTEMSINEMAALFQSKDPFLVRVQDNDTPANYYRQGQGTMSDYKETSSQDGIIAFDFTIDISGDLDLVA
jgi:hypothetical protein